MRTILFALCCLLVLCSYAQRDSTTAIEPRYLNDGKLWHELPPPMNLVNAGLLLQHDGYMQRDATYVAIAGLAAGALLYTENQAVGGAVVVASFSVSFHLHLRGAQSRRKAGQLLQNHYSVLMDYDIVPDSIDAVRPHRIKPR